MARKKIKKLPPAPDAYQGADIQYPNFSFDIFHRDSESRARLGRLNTPHGTVETPNFIVCGTKASVKALNPMQVKEAGADFILANTYHLMIQPGADTVEKLGGLHKMMNWNCLLYTSPRPRD